MLVSMKPYRLSIGRKTNKCSKAGNLMNELNSKQNWVSTLHSLTIHLTRPRFDKIKILSNDRLSTNTAQNAGVLSYRVAPDNVFFYKQTKSKSKEKHTS